MQGSYINLEPFHLIWGGEKISKLFPFPLPDLHPPVQTKHEPLHSNIPTPTSFSKQTKRRKVITTLLYPLINATANFSDIKAGTLPAILGFPYLAFTRLTLSEDTPHPGAFRIFVPRH
ncbi:hypothetical protein CEXT_357861 [Caerostris extrusa]|uniref:Uncharacterized protein n=1 Tax=Caerostris extrusa TaxID=172846 RepID=A0AAV4XT80_CAEEX|nr:hypothetical protein CEXT_357861 [Caerostris extrusa]